MVLILIVLDRATEQMIAGNRPSAYGKIKVGGKKDGTITAWQSDTWATGGCTGGGSPPLPHVYSNIPNQRLNHTAISVNAGPQRAWRAPNNQQASYLTCCAIEDFAAKVVVDPMEVFAKNAGLTPRAGASGAALPDHTHDLVARCVAEAKDPFHRADLPSAPFPSVVAEDSMR